MKLVLSGTGCISEEGEKAQIEEMRSKGFGYPPETAKKRLAVVGGGPSVLDNLDELKQFDGDIWACGSAFKFCLDNGIECTFFLIDPTDSDMLDIEKAKTAILASCCNQSVVNKLKNAKIYIFDLVHNGNHGPTTATAAPHLALQLGYEEVTFYGCDGSFPVATETHAYKYPQVTYLLQVMVGEKSFLTHPELLMQSEYLAAIIRAAGKFFKQKSGGLLEALVNSPDYDVVAGNQAAYNLIFGKD